MDMDDIRREGAHRAPRRATRREEKPDQLPATLPAPKHLVGHRATIGQRLVRVVGVPIPPDAHPVHHLLHRKAGVMRRDHEKIVAEALLPAREGEEKRAGRVAVPPGKAMRHQQDLHGIGGFGAYAL